MVEMCHDLESEQDARSLGTRKQEMCLETDLFSGPKMAALEFKEILWSLTGEKIPFGS